MRIQQLRALEGPNLFHHRPVLSITTFTVKISFSEAAQARAAAGDELRQAAAAGAAAGQALTFDVADWAWDLACDQRTLTLVLDPPCPGRLH